MGLFDGKVVVVTGAGGGLGRAYALAFAEKGAKVVVNDLGGTRDGVGHGNAMADLVVNEIKEAGGVAVANYDTVATMEGAGGITQTALDSFGQIDVLVNNAGILRDKSMLKMTEQMFDLVVEVHLKGTWACSFFAAKAMLEAGNGGRIITTSSYAGLKGNFGQSNYAAAKAGIAGLTRTMALEFGRKGVTVNCIAPLAKTRLTDDIDMIPDEAKPEFMVPMVEFLASDLASEVNGRIFGCHVNHYFEYVMEMTAGIDKKAVMWTAEEVASRLDDISRTKAEMAPKGDASAGGPADLGQKCFAVFEATCTAFSPERAGDWQATLHFKIAGAGDFTMKVGGGNVNVSRGANGEPTCVVKLDAETFLGMADGSIDGNQAFMQGKISASNLNDMIKYGSSFKRKKAQAAVKAAIAAFEGPQTGGDRVNQIFSAVTTAFLPEKAGEWAAVLHFQLDGADDYTVTVKDKTAAFDQGLKGTATCVVKMSAETFIGMAEGTIDGNQAFMQGKVTATNIKDMIKYGSCFDAKKIKVALAAAAPSGEEPIEEKPDGVNFAMLGARYVTAPTLVKAKQTIAYAHATNDSNPAYLDTEADRQIIAPVLFPVRLLAPAMGRAALDPRLNADLGMLLHGEQDMRFIDPIRPGDLIQVKSEITKIEDKTSGQVVDVTGNCYRDGRLVVQSISTLFIRKPGGGKKDKKTAAELPAFTFEQSMTVRSDQSFDYAEASGDHNPIHLDDAVGKAVGLGGIILHGLCTMAFSSQAVISNAADANPTRLKRLKVRFSKPVKPGDVLTTQGYLVDETSDVKTVGFRVINQDGVAVIVNGIAEIAKC